MPSIAYNGFAVFVKRPSKRSALVDKRKPTKVDSGTSLIRHLYRPGLSQSEHDLCTQMNVLPYILTFLTRQFGKPSKISYPNDFQIRKVPMYLC